MERIEGARLHINVARILILKQVKDLQEAFNLSDPIRAIEFWKGPIEECKMKIWRNLDMCVSPIQKPISEK